MEIRRPEKMRRSRQQQLQQQLEEDGVRDWAGGGLPQDLVEMILEQLPFVDHLNFADVCMSWKSIVIQYYYSPPKGKGICGIPLLLMSGQQNSNTRTCFNILEDEDENTTSDEEKEKGKGIYELELQEAHRKYYIWGSFQNWLVAVKLVSQRSFLQISLLNPFSKIKFVMPKTEMRFYHLVVLSAPPTHQNCVCMIVGNDPKELAFWNPGGAQAWHRYGLPNTKTFETAVYCNGSFYLLNTVYSIMVVDANSVVSTMNNNIGDEEEIQIQVHDVGMPYSTQRNDTLVRRYLVESCGEVLLVGRFTCGFEIYRLELDDQKKMAWVELDSLGDRILFLGRNCCTSFSAGKELGRPELANSICFTSDHSVDPIFCEWDSSWEGSDIHEWAIYSLDYVGPCTMCPKHLAVGGSKQGSWAPTWITAPLWWYFENRK